MIQHIFPQRENKLIEGKLVSKTVLCHTTIFSEETTTVVIADTIKTFSLDPSLETGFSNTNIFSTSYTNIYHSYIANNCISIAEKY